MLTQEQLKFIINYDPQSGEFTWNNPHKQGPAKPGARAGTVKWCGPIGRKVPYVYIHFGRKWYRAHRLAKELLALRNASRCQHQWNTLQLVECGGRYQYCTLCGAKKVAE